MTDNIEDILINIDNIKLYVSPVSAYYDYHNRYYWEEIECDNEEYKDTPLYEIPIEKYGEAGIRPIYESELCTGVCFGRFTIRYPKRSTDSRILFYLVVNRKKYTRPAITNNHCWMSKEMLWYWIETGRKESGLDFFFDIIETNNGDDYTIRFDFKKLTRVQMKYVLFWTRYTFEYPASMCALDAMILKQQYYKNELLNNLLTLTSDLQASNNKIRISSSQCLSVTGLFMTKEVLRSRLKNCDSIRQVYFFACEKSIFSFEYGGYGGGYYIFDVPIKSIIKDEEEEGKLFFDPAKDWIDQDERFEQYHKLYPIFKEHIIK